MGPIQNPVIPTGQIILITGANGYIASHVVDQLLEAGYKVRGTVRDLKRTAWVQEFFDKKYGSGKFDAIEISDQGKKGVWDEPMKDVAAIAHIAGPTSPDPNPHKVVDMVVGNIETILEAASKSPSMKRFVLTSSSLAATGNKPDKEFTVDNDSYNEEDTEAAFAPPPYDASRMILVYNASKTRGEQALWKWVTEHKPGFQTNAVLPSANFGRVLSPEHQGCPFTVGMLKAVTEGQFDSTIQEPQHFINVQDTARLHVAALLHPDVVSERVFGHSAPYNWDLVLDIFREILPGKKLPDNPGFGRDLSKIVPRERAEKLLKDMGRPGFTGLKESLEENKEQLA